MKRTRVTLDPSWGDRIEFGDSMATVINCHGDSVVLGGVAAARLWEALKPEPEPEPLGRMAEVKFTLDGPRLTCQCGRGPMPAGSMVGHLAGVVHRLPRRLAKLVVAAEVDDARANR